MTEPTTASCTVARDAAVSWAPEYPRPPARLTTAASPTMALSTTMSRTRSAVVSTETKPCRGMRMPPSWPSGEIGWTRRRAGGIPA